MNYIHLAIPVFFLLIGLELALARIVEKDYYRLTDSINDLSCGIIQQVLDVFLKTVLFAGYLYLFGHYRLFTLPARSLPTWVAGFLGVDLLYYWFHRWSHEMNAGWAAHIVHHQSEEYNLAVALRQGAFQGSFSWVFYLPLALLGLPPLVFLTVSSFNTLYQFWIHTRTIGRLGPLEWVLNTPSHHRVHHGRNPKYIDRNHGGTLIVWDRLFGTFQGEEEEPVYGITTPL
ncbi:MAG TPA: sterol desaturase family protein, partial [Vicinamibacteria bacterium]|nr:sterol desaturase family protein [Vicinamibacteria bacterium]